MHRAALSIVSAVLVLMFAPKARAGDLPDLFPALPWSPAGSFPNQFFGLNSAPAGDVNGDGYGDIVVSIGVEDTAQVRAVLYLGGPDGPSLVPDWTFTTGPEDMRLVHPAGDVNGDGYGDILVSRAFATVSNQPFAGRVAVFHGGPAGLPAAPDYELLPPVPAANLFFGIAADFAGDVNGDGFADVVVGAPFHSEGGFSQRGVAYVYHGGPSGLAPAPARTLVGGPFAQGQFGGAAATAGDVDADGFDDLVVGATGVPTPFLRGGTVSIFLGSPAGIAAVADTVLPGLANDSFCGTSVSTAGDFNGDGYADVLFGSPGAGGSVGRADLAFGGPNGIDSRMLLSSPTAPAQDAYGTLVTTLGDTDGDGRPEFAIGGRSAAQTIGRAFVFGGPGVSLIGELFPMAGATGYVQSIAPSGDVDGDGLSEILVSDQYAEGTGRAYLRGRIPKIVEGAFGWPLTAPQPGTRFGQSLAIVQTRTSLALPYLLIGDPQFNDMGRVTEHRGGIESNVATAISHSVAGTALSQGLGTRVADAGDVDGDGWGDYVVSSPTTHGGTFQNPILQIGRVDLVRGTISTPAAPIPLLSGTREFDRVGSALTGRGDVNGDGYHDVLVGAREADTATLSNAGKAWVLFGGPAPPPPWTIEGSEAGQGLGAGVALLDFDGDGYTDVALGSTSPSAGPQLPGKVQIHYGGPGGPATIPGLVLTSTTVTFGSAVAALGDVNGDGVSDLGVGAPLENNRGVVRVFAGTLGRSQSQRAIRTYLGTQDGARFGETMAGGGDVDGDGFGDLAIGQPFFDGGHTDEGRAYLYLGAPNEPEAEPAVTLEPNLTGAEMGASLAPLADANADGFADWIVGAPGGASSRVHVSFGGGARRVRHQLLLLDSTGDRLLHPPARNSNDHSLIAGLFPHAPMGRMRAGLQFEVRTQNEIFTGVSTITAPFEHEIGVPESKGTIVGDIDIPQAETAFHVRARQYTRSPYFQRSRWVAVDGRAMGEHDFRFVGTAVSVPPGEVVQRDRPALHTVAPSPAAGTTPSRIVFSLPQAAHARLDIHDVRGARVRRLHDGEAIAGTTTLSWNGRDDAGRAVPPGIYFVRFAADGVHETARFVRLGVR